MKKDRIDLFGASALVMFSFLMGLNHVLIKLVNAGFSPAFQAGFRSVCAFGPVLIFALIARRKLSVSDGTLGAGIVVGLLFSGEFLLLFNALEFTSVNRASVLFYTMPIWVALAAHFLILGERLTARRALGLAIAIGGVALALLDKAPRVGPDAWIGDLMCLVAAGMWATLAMCLRVTRLRGADPEMQLLYQLGISAVILTATAPLFGPIIREITPTLLGIFAFQVLAVVCVGFLSWFWILRIYPASDMAAFSFLAPVFGVICAWLVLGEEISLAIWGALVLVSIGIALVSWRPR
ncbi:MAG: DMT family transporter [Pseudomonadota bacterium]